MSVIKLTNMDRDSIVNRLIRHRFTKEHEKLVAEFASLAEAFYCDLFGKKQRDLMASLPEGWLGSKGGLSVTCSGERDYLNFNGVNAWGSVFVPVKRPPTVERLFPGSYRDRSYRADEPLAIRRKELNTRKNAHLKEVEDARRNARSVTARATTVGALIKLWPEIEPFCPKSAGQSIVALPAIPLSQLNDVFRLPAKGAASA